MQMSGAAVKQAACILVEHRELQHVQGHGVSGGGGANATASVRYVHSSTW